MAEELPPNGDPRLRRLRDYLAAKAPHGRLPGRQHLDPLEIPDLLPYLRLVDVVPRNGGGLRYRIRLVGSEVASWFGVDGTGKFIDEVFTTAVSQRIIENYGMIVATKRPQYLQSLLSLKEREHVAIERAAFPLARDGEDVDMILFIFARLPSGLTQPAAFTAERPTSP